MDGLFGSFHFLFFAYRTSKKARPSEGSGAQLPSLPTEADRRVSEDGFPFGKNLHRLDPGNRMSLLEPGANYLFTHPPPPKKKTKEVPDQNHGFFANKICMGLEGSHLPMQKKLRSVSKSSGSSSSSCRILPSLPLKKGGILPFG